MIALARTHMECISMMAFGWTLASCATESTRAMHLRDATSLLLLRRGEEIELRWDTPPRTPDGPSWSYPRGTGLTSAEAFRNTLVALDRELIAAMDARVALVEGGWQRAGVELDAATLRRDHADRARWMERTLTRPYTRSHAWDDVIAAVIALERSVPR